MNQKDIEALAKSIHDRATVDGSIKVHELAATALQSAGVSVSEGIMGLLGSCIVQLSKTHQISDAEAGRVLAELLLGKARAAEQRKSQN